MAKSTYSFERINGLDQVNTVTASYQINPSVVTYADGGGAVFFYSGTGISARLLDTTGEPMGGQVDIGEQSSAFDPDATLLSNGNIAVTWREDDNIPAPKSFRPTSHRCRAF